MSDEQNFAGFIRAVAKAPGEVWDDENYPFGLNAIKSWDHIALHPGVTFFVGENGSGKLTLVEAIALAAGFNPEGGSKDHMFSSYDSHSSVGEHLRLVREPRRRERDGYFLRAETYYNQARYIGSQANPDRYGGQHLLCRSHGEGIFALFEHRFNRDSLIILDEPEAALSPQRQLAVLARLHELVCEDCQFIIATHSPILMAYPHCKRYQINDDGILEVDWENIEHVDTLRQFLKYPERFLDILLEN